MDILLTFTGFQDPYTISLVEKEEQPGPILSLVNEKSFDKIILFSTPRTDKNTYATKEALQVSHKNLNVEVRDLALQDPTDYFSILKELRANVRNICRCSPGPRASSPAIPAFLRRGQGSRDRQNPGHCSTSSSHPPGGRRLSRCRPQTAAQPSPPSACMTWAPRTAMRSSIR